MYITSPKSHRKIFLDNNVSSYEDRLKSVLRVLNNKEISEYLVNNNKIISPRQILSYEKANRILENMATYLLLGQYKNSDILTLYKIRRYNLKEITLSSLKNSNAENLVYGTDFSDDSVSYEASSELTESETRKSEVSMSFGEIKKSKARDIKSSIKYRNTKSYRFERIYSTKPIKTYRLKMLKSKDENGKETPVRNAWKQPIWIVQYGVIGGRKGIIDQSKPYVSKWCIVDIDGCFEFNGSKMKIDLQACEQYQAGEDNRCEMEKILCYYVPSEDKNYFFDEKINPVYEINILSKI